MADDKDTLAPEIRFKGFTDAWVQRKLGEIAPLQRGFDLPKSEMIDGEYPVVMSNGINGYHVEFKAKAPGVVTGRSGTIGNLHYIEADYWPHNTTLWVTGFKGNYPKYIYYLYDKIDLSRFGTGTGVPTLNRNDVHDEIVSIPCVDEQIKISDFFRILDNAITLYKSKLDGMKKLKNGYLQQMFPQAGESAPRVRFAGFTEPWAQRKLGNIVERVQGNDGRMDLPTLTISAGSGWLDQRERFSNNIAGKEQENYTLLSKGELSYNKGNSKLAKYGVVFELKTHKEALVPRVYHSFKTTHESSAAFLEYMFATKIPDSELAKLITSGARMDGLLNIGFEAFMGIGILIPSKAEQITISSFLRNFDEQIAAQQTKLDKLKQLKAAYLQKMFL